LLCAAHHDRSRHAEIGNAAHSCGMTGTFIGAHGLRIRIGAQHALQLLGVQPDLEAQAHQGGMIRQVRPFREVGLEEPLLGLIPLAFRLGELEQAVRVKGTADHRDVHVVHEPQALRALHHAIHPGLGIGTRAPVLLHQHAVHVQRASLWRPRIQLEAAPNHLHTVALWKAFHRRLELALSDVAERADDIAPDLHHQPA
jgi:hypothetical protein